MKVVLAIVALAAASIAAPISAQWPDFRSPNVYLHFHRRIVRLLIPRISAACHHVIFLAMARRITSCTFIVRSHSAAGICSMPSSGWSLTLASGQLVC